MMKGDYQRYKKELNDELFIGLDLDIVDKLRKFEREGSKIAKLKQGSLETSVAFTQAAEKSAFWGVGRLECSDRGTTYFALGTLITTNTVVASQSAVEPAGRAPSDGCVFALPGSDDQKIAVEKRSFQATSGSDDHPITLRIVSSARGVDPIAMSDSPVDEMAKLALFSPDATGKRTGLESGELSACEVTQAIPAADHTNFLYLACTQQAEVGAPLFVERGDRVVLAALAIHDRHAAPGAKDRERFIVSAVSVANGGDALATKQPLEKPALKTVR